MVISDELFESPSKTLSSFSHLFSALKEQRALDLGCGYGRNALLLARLGFDVLCVDRDLNRLKALSQKINESLPKPPSHPLGKLLIVNATADETYWPFPHQSFSLIVCIHFPKRIRPIRLESLLKRPGYIYVETFGNHGMNYLELPRAGEYRSQLERSFNLEFYRERKAGPPNHDAVTVRLLARLD